MRRFRRNWVSFSCFLGSALTGTALAGAFGLLVVESLPIWRTEGIGFVFGREWYFRDQIFGALPMIHGSAVVALIAMVLALPAGIGAAVFIAEYLPPKLRFPVKSAVELLAGIPSVVYGLLAVLFLREWVHSWTQPFGALTGDGLLTAGLVLAVMVLPTIATLSEDALRAVPGDQRSAARGLGLTRAETVLHVAVPRAAPGLLAAALLALGRALGETVAVFLVIGRMDNNLPEHFFSPENWLQSGQTLTSKLGGPETHIAYGDPLHWAAMLGLALLLLALVLACLALVALPQRSFRGAAAGPLDATENWQSRQKGSGG